MTESKKTYAITHMNARIYSFLLDEDQRAVEIHCDSGQEDSLIGNIYVGKVKNIAKNIGAAFVEIAPGSVCYLPLTDIKCPVYTKKGSSKNLQAGDELLVQVSREGIKTKFPSVTTNLILHGKYVLLTTGDTKISVSSKISREEKQRLIGMVEAMEYGSTDYGWLLRTNARDADESFLRKDMERLKRQYDTLMQQAGYRTCFSCMLKMPPAYLKRLSDVYDTSAGRIITDDEDLYEEIRAYLTDCQPEDLGKLSFYRDELLPMKKLYALEHQLAQALQEKVWLNSGGYLIIQPTEALTVIDVNTGKYEGGRKKEDTFLKINREAAIEIVRQLRLRNLSGIIIVDFINMEDPKSNAILLSLLDRELRKDPIRTVLVDMTKLSLVEITRMKKERPLAESIAE